MDVVVQHEGKRPTVPGLHQPMGDGVGPGEAIEQYGSARHRCSEIEQDVCQEDDVRGSPNRFHRDAGLRLDDERVDDCGKAVPPRNHCRIEFVASGIIEVGERLNGNLIMVLRGFTRRNF